jgi:Ca2+-binding RTX toxin-like protein
VKYMMTLVLFSLTFFWVSSARADCPSPFSIASDGADIFGGGTNAVCTVSYLPPPSSLKQIVCDLAANVDDDFSPAVQHGGTLYATTDECGYDYCIYGWDINYDATYNDHPFCFQFSDSDVAEIEINGTDIDDTGDPEFDSIYLHDATDTYDLTSAYPGTRTIKATVFAGDGDDYIEGSWEAVPSYELDGLYGEGGSDTIYGLAGPDYIDGYSGDNFLYGGDGADDIFAGDGYDTIDGGNGPDEIYAGDGNNVVTGGFGNDVIYTGSGQDRISGNGDDDLIYAGGNNDIVCGGE